MDTKMNPQEFRLILVCSYLTLAMLGIGYNKLIATIEQWKWSKGMTSFSVVVGCSFTLAVLTLFFRGVSVPFWADMVIVFGGFACSGSPMIIGHRMRYARTVQEEEDEARRKHRPLKWPHDMKSLRDAAGEEAMSGARTLGSIGTLPHELEAKISRVRASLVKIAALMARAGAPIRIEKL